MFPVRRLVVALLYMLAGGVAAAGPLDRPIDAATAESVILTLTERHGPEQTTRARRGVEQVAARWWESDGNASAFARFCEDRFLSSPADLSRAFRRMQQVMEQIDGHLHEVRRELTTPLDLATGDVQPIDRLLSSIDLAAHVDENLYSSRVAFLALLNFPVHTLEDRLQDHAPPWDRETWARSRMMDRFAERVPAEVTAGVTRAFTTADQYIADYNIRMDRLRTAAGESLFPEGLRLITHWGLRDELKSRYADPDGLTRQRAILQVMERIVLQEIPRDAIDNPEVEWCPETNRIRAVGSSGPWVESPREPDTRYAMWLDVFRAVRAADPYTPAAPTFIDRRFQQDRQIPEAQVEKLLVSVLESPEFRRTAAWIRERLGRDLEPFDIWYNGFRGAGAPGEADLDRMLAGRYPDVQAFQDDLEPLLGRLGFSKERSAWLSERIVVDPSRGAGHAMGAVRSEDRAHLRTRVGSNGMDYKGYNIAVHELGHNVEQVFSLHAIDHWWLSGVPNSAFTEAMAFLFQNRDLELLGLAPPPESARRLEALDTLWSTAEIGGVALVDMRVWRWLYANPDATPSALREATVRIARDVWNRYYAPVFGGRDELILGIYSHMIVYGLYLPDYPLGHIIAFQLAAGIDADAFGEEFERVARLGRLTPDRWMVEAVGSGVSSEALLAAARRALDGMETGTGSGATPTP